MKILSHLLFTSFDQTWIHAANLLCFQYGRINIESANKKRGIIDHTEPEPEPVNYKPDTPPTPKKNGLVKKLSQNGIESLISKESLILVPEGGEPTMQNGHAQEKVDHNEQTENIINSNLETADQQVTSVSIIQSTQNLSAPPDSGWICAISSAE